MRNRCVCGNEKDARAYRCKQCHMKHLAKLKTGKISPIKGTHRVGEEIACPICGKTFWSKTGKANKFCSSQCYTQWRVDMADNPNHFRSTISYRRWRQAAIDASSGRCSVCQGRGKLLVHHIESIAKSPDKIHDPDNALVICYSCHAKLHDSISHVNTPKRRV